MKDKIKTLFLGSNSFSKEFIDKQKLPRTIVYLTIAICILPFILNILGIDFGSTNIPFNIELANNMVDHHFHSLAGDFTHALLEWTAFTVAILTVILAFTHYAIKRDPATPVIAIALLCAGFMDAFHTLAATRLVEAAAPNEDLIPFTWALCRLFNSLICLTGVSLFLFRKENISVKHSSRIIILISIIFMLAAYITIYLCAASLSLPQTIFPNNIISRPWDVYPFIIFVVTGFAYYAFFARRPGPFLYSLLLSTLPDLAVQMHMALGSTALFDSHFNIAHFLKIISYLVPFIGLAYEYICTYKKADKLAKMRAVTVDELNDNLKKRAYELDQKAIALKKSNQELEKFAYITSHDLKAPLRGISDLIEYIEDDLGSYFKSENSNPDVKKNMDRVHRQVERMNCLIKGILEYSKVGKVKINSEMVEINKLIELIIDDLGVPKLVQIEVEKNLPSFETDQIRISQIFSNLISNAVKYHNDISNSIIKIGFEEKEQFYEFYVSDNGPGIDSKYFDKIFEIFQTLQSRDEIESTGIGLSIVKKIVENFGGYIKVESTLGIGTTFKFTWPKDIQELLKTQNRSKDKNGENDE